MRARTRSARRHLPAIATAIVIAWLAAVYAYSSSGTPAAARKVFSKRLVTTALGGRAPSGPFERRARPLTVDIRASESPSPTMTPAGDRKKPRPQKKERTRKKQHKRTRDASDVGHSLPVAPRLVSVAELKAPHHDYPAWDLPVDRGTKIFAVTAGYVIDTTRSGGCGNGIIIRGVDRFTYTYCHGARKLVRRGRYVDAGDPILRSGNTGDSTGPHLHLQIRSPRGKLVCPQHLLRAWSVGKAKPPGQARSRGCHTGAHHHKHRNKRR